MSFVNHYKPSPPKDPITPENDHHATPLDEYDYNFIYPVTILHSDRVELRPLLPSRDGDEIARILGANPDLMMYDGWPLERDAVFGVFEKIRRFTHALGHAVYTAPKDRPDASPSDYVLAGVTNLHHLSDDDLSGVIGMFIFPQFQRTHVSTHALGLALKRLLDMPAPSSNGNPVSEQGGFGYRRVVWTCDDLNKASFGLATRMGFKLEGVRRNMNVIPEGKPATGHGREGDLKNGQPSINQYLTSITCKDWEEGGREMVEQQMARTS